MKVMHLLQSPHFSGAENVVCQIIAMMSKETNIDSFYCSCDGPIRIALEERKINFCPIQKMSIKEVKRVICEQNPDIIHAHDRMASLVAALTSGRIPYISHIHYNAINTRSISLKAFIYLLAAYKAKHIFWVSQSSYDGYVFHRLLEKKSSVLYNIINVEDLYRKMLLDRNKYDYDVIYVGRIVEQKDPLRLLDVCKEVVAKHQNARIAIVGTGELENSLKEKATALHLNDNVFFIGYLSNPLKMIHDSKVMLMTSKFEGTPMCALEALALGVPIISTPADGMRILIRNEENGFLSDDNEVMANKLIRIIEEPEYRKSLSENAVIFSDKYNDVDSYRQKILQEYLKWNKR